MQQQQMMIKANFDEIQVEHHLIISTEYINIANREVRQHTYNL
jgi:hypothetical protein